MKVSLIEQGVADLIAASETPADFYKINDGALLEDDEKNVHKISDKANHSNSKGF
ncbi:MAG: hypothetical protein R2799_03240 [Crocinitomicaceae bacterium]